MRGEAARIGLLACSAESGDFTLHAGILAHIPIAYLINFRSHYLPHGQCATTLGKLVHDAWIRDRPLDEAVVATALPASLVIRAAQIAAICGGRRMAE